MEIIFQQMKEEANKSFWEPVFLTCGGIVVVTILDINKWFIQFVDKICGSILLKQFDSTNTTVCNRKLFER